jgi:hypothetical protein
MGAKAPSQRLHKHRAQRNNNQNGGAIALTPFLHLEIMMLGWHPAQALGTKKG